MNDEVKLNLAQQKFLDFYLAQKDAVNNLIQDCILNNQKIFDLEQKLNEQKMINQKVMNENHQIKLNMNKTSEAKYKSDNDQQYMETNLKIYNKVNLDLKSDVGRLEQEIAQLKNEKEALIKERNDLIEERNIFNNQKLIFESTISKIETDIHETTAKVYALIEERESHLKTIRELEANLNNKEKEIEEIKTSFDKISNEKKFNPDSLDAFANFMKIFLAKWIPVLLHLWLCLVQLLIKQHPSKSC
jgi:chromosome segregation ATPase